MPAPASASKKPLAKNQDFRCDNEMARQGEIREGEIPPFEDDAPGQDVPRIPEGSQQDRPAEGEGSQLYPSSYVITTLPTEFPCAARHPVRTRPSGRRSQSSNLVGLPSILSMSISVSRGLIFLIHLKR